MDMLADEAGSSRRASDNRSWVSGVYRHAERNSSDSIRPFNQQMFGTALGGDLYRNGPIRIGAAFGYTGSEVELGGDTGEGEFDSVHGGLYVSYRRNNYFLDAALTGGYQSGDAERMVIVDGVTRRAKGDSDGYLFGTGVHTGWAFELGDGWSAQPSVNFSYIHRHQDQYSEHGGGDAAVTLDSESSDTARMNWQLQVARAKTVNLGDKTVTLRPSGRLGLGREWALDNRNVQGRFQVDGTPFSLHMDARNETTATFGAGIEAQMDGWTAFAIYDGVASQVTDRNTVSVGVRTAW